jgi:hypothetical protein
LIKSMSVLISYYPNFEWLIKGNQSLFEDLEIFNYNGKFIDDLVEFLKSEGVQGLQAKFLGCSSSKFWALIGELQVARILCESGKKVSIQSDPIDGSTFPDIMAQDRTFGNVLVEVKEIRLIGVADKSRALIAAFLKDRPFRIDIELSEFLSVLKYEGKEKQKQEDQFRTDWIEFENMFDPARLHSVTTTNGTVFHCSKITGQRGYIGTVTTKVHSLERIKEKIKFDLLDQSTGKAGKRAKWVEDYPNVPYVVAFELRDTIHDGLVRTLLFGYNDTYGEENPDASKLLSVQRAISRGWRSFFERNGIIHNSVNYLKLFLDLEEDEGLEN